MIDTHRILHGVAGDYLANFDNATTQTLPVTKGASVQLQGGTQPLRSVSVNNYSHLWVYVGAGSFRPGAGYSIKEVRPYSTSVFPIGATRYASFVTDVGPDGSVGILQPNESISVSASPLPVPAAQDTSIPIVPPTQVSKSASGIATPATLWTPAATKKIRVFAMFLGGDTAGIYTATDGVNTFAAIIAAANGGEPLDFLPNGFLLQAGAGAALIINGPAASHVTAYATGDEE